ncbi:unnamed protein product [Withania somnifera]
MPQRNSRNQESRTPSLRRSPRFTATGKQIEVSKSSGKSIIGSRRSPRLNIGTLQNKGEVNTTERTVARGSTRDTPGRRVLGCASADNSVEKRNGVIARSGKPRVSRCTLGRNERPVPLSEVAECGEDGNKAGRKQAGLKRKRTQGMDENGVANGWTNEQEVALQTAYFAAKATPNFWKKVAKMVPGKSAKDCFDKIHSDFMTPPQPQPRSRVKKMNTSSLSPCATKLLQSTAKNTNKRKDSKSKNHLSRKAVRQLLQKQTDIDRHKEADFFNALESSTDPNTRAFCQNTIFLTPERNKEGLSYLRKCLERSSSGYKKHRSRSSGSSGATLTSPPVLKPIKNKALHERYVDQLHCREAKRKIATSRIAKGHQNKNVVKIDVIKAAKNALISEARDAINQFQNLQTCALSSYDDYDENHNCDDDEDGR